MQRTSWPQAHPRSTAQGRNTSHHGLLIGQRPLAQQYTANRRRQMFGAVTQNITSRANKLRVDGLGYKG